MPNKYDHEKRAKAVRLVKDYVEDYAIEWATVKAVSSRLGISTETLPQWVRQSKLDSGESVGVTTDYAHENRELQRKVRELEQTVEVFKAATSCFVRERDPLHR